MPMYRAIAWASCALAALKMPDFTVSVAICVRLDGNHRAGQTRRHPALAERRQIAPPADATRVGLELHDGVARRRSAQPVQGFTLGRRHHQRPREGGAEPPVGDVLCVVDVDRHGRHSRQHDQQDQRHDRRSERLHPPGR